MITPDDVTIHQRHRVAGSWPRGARVTDCQKFAAVAETPSVPEAITTAKTPAQLRREAKQWRAIDSMAFIIFAGVAAYIAVGLAYLAWSNFP